MPSSRSRNRPSWAPPSACWPTWGADDGRAVDVRQRLQEKLRQHERELREERLRADDLAAAEAAEDGDKKKKKKKQKKKKKKDAEADAGAAPRKIRVGEASWTNPDGTQRTIPAGEYDEREWLAQCFEQQLGWADAMKHPARERAAEAAEDLDSDADADADESRRVAERETRQSASHWQ